MSVETATTINQLNATLPAAGDPKAEGDDHIRLIKSTVKATFPNVTGAVTPTHVEFNYLVGVTSAVQTQLDAITGTFASYAPLASPTFTGSPKTTTPALTDDPTRIASLAAVLAAIGSVNAQTPLVNQVETGTSVTLAKGVHHILTNASLTTCTAPVSAAAGDRFRVSVANGRTDNVINWNGLKHENLSDSTMKLNGKHLSLEFSYINATVGWKVL